MAEQDEPGPFANADTIALWHHMIADELRLALVQMKRSADAVHELMARDPAYKVYDQAHKQMVRARKEWARIEHIVGEASNVAALNPEGES